jgi:hypothetical protein
MSNLQIIERLCAMLDEAQIIIRAQAGMLEMHGIETDNGTLESDRAKLLADVEGSI